MSERSESNTQSWGRLLVEAVKEYATEKGLQYELFSGDWIARLDNGVSAKYLFGHDFGLNSSSTVAICTDKSATYQVLTREGIPALEHALVLRPGSLGASDSGVFDYAKRLFNKYDQNIVCKPNQGGGVDVYHIDSLQDLDGTLISLFAKYRDITISPFIKIKSEYRVCILNNMVELMYEKVIQDNSWQHNLSLGAVPQVITDESLKIRLSALAIDAAQATECIFANVDIIEVDGVLSIIEINTHVLFERYSDDNESNLLEAKNIYKKALDLLF